MYSTEIGVETIPGTHYMGRSGLLAGQVPIGLCPRVNARAPLQRGAPFPINPISLSTAEQIEPQVPTGRDNRKSINSLRIALCNEGKLTRGKLHAMSLWTKDNADLVIVSEGAWPHRSSMVEPGTKFVSPLSQRWGGVGILCREQILTSRRVKMFSEDRVWSVTSLPLDKSTTIVGAYISPPASLHHITDMLRKVEEQIGNYPNVIFGGDLNSKTGSESRVVLETWAAANRLEIRTHGLLTHFSPQGNGTDLDLLYVRGVSANLVKVERPVKGHSRLIFEVTVPEIKMHHEGEKINWKLLPERNARFNTEVTREIEKGLDVATALVTAGRQVLGEAKNYRRQIPRRARKIIRRERNILKSIPRGTEEYTECLERINSTIQRFFNLGWKRKIAVLRQKPFDQEGWRIVKCLSKPRLPREIGLPDHELHAKLDDIYNSNKTNRAEWNISRLNQGTSTPLETHFTPTEVMTAIKSLPNRICPGPDQIPYEALKACCYNPTFLSTVVCTFNDYLDNGYNLNCIESQIIPLPKANCAEVRPISLLPSMRKLLEKVILQRVTMLGDRLHESQSGFRKGMNPLRCLLRIHLDILEARRTSKLLIVNTYDVKKAFDSIPKSFIATRYRDYVHQHAPRLAQLLYEVLRVPVTTQVGSSPLTLGSGVPQGGILSPSAFNIADDVLGQILGDRLVKFADDNTTLCNSREESSMAEQIIKAHYRYIGCELNPDKTESLAINEGPGTPPVIKILGALVGHSGVQVKVSRESFTDIAGWMASLARVNGLTADQCISISRAKCWAKFAYALPIALPSPQMLTLAWIRLCRTILKTYPTSHSFRLIEACGYLHNPYWWAMETVIRFYRRAVMDAYLERRLSLDAANGGSFGQEVEKYLAPCGITWRQLIGTECIKAILSRARITFTAWMTEEIKKEATRHGVLPSSERRLQPALYLKHPLGRYGFIFQQDSLSPPNLTIRDCLLCGEPGQDTCRHLMFACRNAPTRPQVPLPAWELKDGTRPEQRTLVLNWMKAAWTARKKKWIQAGEPPGIPRAPAGKSQFLNGPGLNQMIPPHQVPAQGPPQNRRRGRETDSATPPRRLPRRPNPDDAVQEISTQTSQFSRGSRTNRLINTPENMQIEESATQNIQIHSTLEPSATITQNLSQNNVETHTDVIMTDHADEPETPHPPCFPHFTIRKSSHRTKRPTPDSVTSDPQTPVNSKKQKKRLALSTTVTKGYDLVRHTAQTSVDPRSPCGLLDTPSQLVANQTIPDTPDAGTALSMQGRTQRTITESPLIHDSPENQLDTPCSAAHFQLDETPAGTEYASADAQGGLDRVAPEPGLRRSARIKRLPIRYRVESPRPRSQRKKATENQKNRKAPARRSRPAKPRPRPETPTPEQITPTESNTHLPPLTPINPPPPNPLTHQPNNPRSCTPPVGRRRAVRWTESHLSRLMDAINQVGGPYEYRKLQLFLPERTTAGITAKVNGLYKASRIIIRDGVYVLLPV